MLKEKLDGILQDEIDRGGCVGSVCMAFHNNEEVYSGIFGKDNLTDDTQLGYDSIFKMFSMTKPVTAVAVNMLIEQKRLNREDYVDKYLEGFRKLSVMDAEGNIIPASGRIKIKDLLNMTAGVEYPNDQTKAGFYLGEKLFWPMENAYPDKMIPTVELMNRVGGMPLLYEPGMHWNYSLCADILGAVVEVISGESYGEFLRKNIFEPLEMTDTGFYVPEEKLDRLVTMHDLQNGKYVPWDYPFLGTYNRRYKPAFESGGAGLVSTPADYAKFALMLCNMGTLPEGILSHGRAVTLLQPETVYGFMKGMLSSQQMSTCCWDSMTGYNYGNLMRVLENPEAAGVNGPAKGEFGWDGWAGTYFCVDPINKVTFLYFINVTNGNRDWFMKIIKNELYKQLDLS